MGEKCVKRWIHDKRGMKLKIKVFQEMNAVNANSEDVQPDGKNTP